MEMIMHYIWGLWFVVVILGFAVGTMVWYIADLRKWCQELEKEVYRLRKQMNLIKPEAMYKPDPK